MEDYFYHKTVFLKEAINQLNIKEDGIYVDGTFGLGGHSKLILSRLGRNGRLIAIDRDLNSVLFAKRTIFDSRFSIYYSLFSNLKCILKKIGLVGRIDGILLDLGISNFQINDTSRGFSFSKESLLDMRMGYGSLLPAYKWLSIANENEIGNVLKLYGEEPFYKRIASEIVKYNRCSKDRPIKTTLELVNLINRKIGFVRKYRKGNPATKVFQAIRIYINSELDEIKKFLNELLDILSINGYIVIISFHSLEDRLVKNYMKQNSSINICSRLPITDFQINQLFFPRLKSFKKIKPTKEYIRYNLSSRSSILRSARKLR